jgi:site-specific DNA recombinase
MNSYYAYTRVSTVRQGEGVSLQQQRDAIQQYAQRHNLEISQWFEELETAAKAGRPVFSDMVKRLRRRNARGAIIHKIDRSARNLRDWADLGELIDGGIEVHFANESLDLNSRGGRLSADIQAVVAADYIRNLREETRKGLWGRFKQGLFPMPAPLGYLDNGGGKPKTVDPATAPLVRKVFELYSTGRYNLRALSQEVHSLGLRRRGGGIIHPNRLSDILSNPFYMGLIRVKSTNETFAGIHEPLVSKQMFDRVHRIISGKTNTVSSRHDFLYRRRLRCGVCSYSLIGERQRGHVYYRCQTKDCPTNCIREEAVNQAVLCQFARLKFSKEEHAFFRPKIASMNMRKAEEQEKVMTALKLKTGQLTERVNRLMDAYLDRVLDKVSFEQRKSALLMERAGLEQWLAEWQTGHRKPADELLCFLERADSACLAYKLGFPDERRELLEAITSNRLVSGKTLEIMLHLPFSEVANRFEFENGCPRRNTARTWNRLLPRLLGIFEAGSSRPTSVQSTAA